MSMCIYHGNCADGFSAAWTVWKKHPEWKFHAGVYQKEPPSVKGEDVFFVDFSYKRPVMEQLAKEARSITVLDHHKSAMEDLAGSSVLNCHFDMDRSGAMIAWEFFHDEPPPQLIRHVQDRDLWRFKLEYTKEIQAALFSFPYDFQVYDFLMTRMPIEELVLEGKAILRKQNKDMYELLAQVVREIEILGFKVPVACLPYMFASEAGNILAQGQPFAATYYDSATARHFSLRSVAGEGMDVSAIAASFGGGGHANAAGFAVPRTHALAMA